jgi:uncharacterized membrane protein YphA (DoxX/SURF4 family)
MHAAAASKRLGETPASTNHGDTPTKEKKLVIDVFDHETRELARPTSADLSTTPVRTSHHSTHHTAVVVLLPLRIFLAAGWLRAGAEKLIDPQWWNGNKLRTFLGEQHDQALPFFRPVMDNLIAPGAQTVAIVVVLTQLACGLAIAIGKPLRLALRWAFLLNVVFIMTGKVNPSCFYLLMEVVLLLAIADGTIGVRPTSPSWRTVVSAGAFAGLALAVTPYIRTIEPARVIDDPAMMLAFLGFVLAVTLLVRMAAFRPQHTTYIRGVWTTWAAGWMHAKPIKVVRRDYDWRHMLRDAGFSSPPHGPAISTVPPVRNRPTGPRPGSTERHSASTH